VSFGPEPRPGAERSRAGDLSETARIEAFSDGVFAIAITLLVLEVHVPAMALVHAAGGLGRALLQEWPSFLGYVLSFVVCGIMWANHHYIFKLIRRSDHNFVVLNMLLLLFVGFLPFPTAVLARYLPLEEGRRFAVTFYTGFFTVTAIAYNALWTYASRRRRLIGDDVPDAEVAGVTRRFRLGPISYLIATLVSLVSVEASLAIVGGLALLYLLPYRGSR